jgi:choline dehydrogenase
MMNWCSRPDLAAPDLHAFVVQGPHAGPEIAARHDLAGDVFAISPGLMRCRSIGHVRPLGPGIDGALEIQPNFLAEPADLEALVAAVDFVMDMAETPPLAALIERPAAPERRLSRHEAIGFIREACATFYHCCGTAKMGRDPLAVVDETLRVHGLDNLRIVDASVIPVMPSCNTNAPVIALAERAAEMIRT